MFISPSSPPPNLKELNVLHLEKVPVRFILDKKTQNFQLKINKLSNDNSYEKIEFDFDNNLILVQVIKNSKMLAIDFPQEFLKRKSSLVNENLNWETTKTQIIITYKNPNQVIVIDENSEFQSNIITIEDEEEDENPKFHRIRVITDIKEIEDSMKFRYLDKQSNKRFEKNVKTVMKNIETEWPVSIPLKKIQIKKLAELLIEKDFDSYEKALENGYNYDISTNTLCKIISETQRNLEDPSFFQEIKDYNIMDQAINDLEEEENNNNSKNLQKKINPSAALFAKRRQMEKRRNIYLEENGADEKELNFDDGKEYEDYEIKKKNSVYIINENKFKSLVSKANKNFQKRSNGIEIENKNINLKRKRNIFIPEDDEMFL